MQNKLNSAIINKITNERFDVKDGHKNEIEELIYIGKVIFSNTGEVMGKM